MSLIRTFTLLAALGAASPTFADPPKAPAQADKKADKPADKGKKEPLSQATAERFIAFFDKLVAIVVANKEDCPKMAGAMNKHIEENRPLLKLVAEARSQNKHLPQHIKDKIAKKAAEELTPAMVAKCNKDRGVRSALLRILPPPPGSSIPPDEKEREREREKERDGEHEREEERERERK